MSLLKKQYIKEYNNRKASLSHREKAELEEKIWKLSTPMERRHAKMQEGAKQHARGYLLRDAIGESTSLISKRLVLFRAGDASNPLWDLIDAGSPLAIGAAVKLLQEAKKTRGDEESLASAVIRCIDAYMTGGSKMVSADGTWVMRRKVGATGNKLQASPASIKRLVLKYAEQRTAKLPADQATAMAKQLELDMEEVIRSFNQRCVRYLSEAKTRKDVARSFSRKQLRDAYMALRLEPPKKNSPIDLQAVKKQKRLLVRMYHPDSHGDESMQDLYQSVLEAAEIIETVYEQQGGMA